MIAAVIAVGLLITTGGHAAATLPADMAVTNSTCEEGNITAVTVQVDYLGWEPTTVTPHIWSGKQHVQHTWSPENITLEPGVQTVQVEAPMALAEIKGRDAQLYLADGQRRVIENWRTKRCGGD